MTEAQRLLAAYRESLRIRRDEELLRQMSASQLRDIGLQRLADDHFAPIGRDPWLEQPVQILGQGKQAPGGRGNGRRQGVTRP